MPSAPFWGLIAALYAACTCVTGLESTAVAMTLLAGFAGMVALGRAIASHRPAAHGPDRVHLAARS
jgi:hypothetical protein